MAPLRCAHGSCSARAFVQLAKRRYTTANTPTLTGCLEFLAPRTVAAASPPRSSHGAARPLARRSAMSQAGHLTIPKRTFISSAPRKATACVQNPQQDEDGNDMTLEITPRAAKRLSEIMTKDANPNLALRIQVESGGCHGFQYLMNLITIPEKDAAGYADVVREDDTVFQYRGEDAAVGSKHDAARIILDEPSLDLLKGSKVDFTMELIGSQFKIVDNPLASSSCGCGTSFDIKM